MFLFLKNAKIFLDSFILRSPKLTLNAVLYFFNWYANPPLIKWDFYLSKWRVMTQKKFFTPVIILSSFFLIWSLFWYFKLFLADSEPEKYPRPLVCSDEFCRSDSISLPLRFEVWTPLSLKNLRRLKSTCKRPAREIRKSILTISPSSSRDKKRMQFWQSFLFFRVE